MDALMRKKRGRNICHECTTLNTPGRMPEAESMDKEPGGGSPAAHQLLIENELLCFLSTKMDIMTTDHLVKVCCDFYTEREIKSAKKSVHDACGMDGAPVTRNGADKSEKNVRDILLIMHETEDVPRFVAHYLNRLPPVSINHLDATSMIQKMNQLRLQIASLCETVQSIVHGQTIMIDEMETLRKRPTHAGDASPRARQGAALMGEYQRSHELVVPAIPAMLEIPSIPEIPEMSPDSVQTLVKQPDGSLPSPAASEAAEALDMSRRFNYARAVINGTNESTATSTAAVSQPVSSVTAGTSGQHMQMAAAGSRRDRPTAPTHSRRPVTLRGIAPVRRRAEFFVSRLDPLTTANEILSHVRAELNTEDVLCEQLYTLNDNYSSFKVTVDNRHYKRMFTSHMWPEYVVFRRYYQPRNPHNGSS